MYSKYLEYLWEGFLEIRFICRRLSAVAAEEFMRADAKLDVLRFYHAQVGRKTVSDNFDVTNIKFNILYLKFWTYETKTYVYVTRVHPFQ